MPSVVKKYAVYIVGAFFAASFCVVTSSCSLWYFPVENTPEEYEYHMELMEAEGLLGKTKEEVYEMLGHPDTWSMYRGALSFGGGRDCWDESIHVWEYGSDDDKTMLSTDIYFSDDNVTEQIVFRWEEIESGELWSIEQGIASKYR